MIPVNTLGQPIGFPVEQWRRAARPTGITLAGTYCRLERLNPDRHAFDLHQAYAVDTDHRLWTYLAYGPFDSLNDYRDWMCEHCLGEDPLFYAVVDERSGQALGVASYLRINPMDGVIEVGHINYSPLLQKTILATEAMYLMMRHVFDDLRYRRYEWKCDALNSSSRKAASRLGFSFEGIFRQATMYKERNRDTAWYSIIDREWAPIKSAYETWLAPDNFVNEQQRQSLSSLMSRAKQNEA